MLQLMNGPQIAVDDYAIRHKSDGQDELHFEISISDPAYTVLMEEDRIIETTEQQTYTVKQIDAGDRKAKIGCCLDLSDWQTELRMNYSSGNHSATDILSAISPNGWRIEDQTTLVKKRTIEMQAPTPLEIALQVQETFGCAIRFSTFRKMATLLYPEEQRLSNSYVVDTVNLRAAPQFKGKSSDLYTRLYPIGRDGMGIAEVNGGKAYVENLKYTDRIICAVWSDARYEDAKALRDDAQKRVDAAAKPERSWQLNIVDLYRIDPQRWPDMALPIFTVLRLVDGRKGFCANVQVVEDQIFPYYPERNNLTVSTIARSIQRTLRGVCNALNNPNSTFYQKLNAGGNL